MKVYIIAALSADGFIAKNSKEFVDWTSSEDKQFFRSTTKKSGVVVVGGNTFRTFKSPLPGRRNIVYSRHNIDHPDIETTQEPPEDLVKRLKAEGIKELAICGGSTIYSMFLKSGVVSDIYLTYEPVIFGNGVKLFSDEINVKLAVEEMKKLNDDTFLIHYKVKK